MLTICKYPIPASQQFSVDMPKESQVLTVQQQIDGITMWAFVNTDTPTVKRQFFLAATGVALYLTVGELSYVGTFQVDGKLAFHLFEIIS